MIYEALALLAAFAALVMVSGAFASLIRTLIRQHARERDLLVNQLCALAGRPWQTPPAQDVSFAERPTFDADLVTSPEQWPDE